jgi:hypothetical protein
VSATPTVLAIDWRPVAAWAGAAATLLAVIVTALVALRYFDYLHGPRLLVTFEATEPWCRQGEGEAGARGLGGASSLARL